MAQEKAVAEMLSNQKVHCAAARQNVANQVTFVEAFKRVLYVCWHVGKIPFVYHSLRHMHAFSLKSRGSRIGLQQSPRRAQPHT